MRNVNFFCSFGKRIVIFPSWHFPPACPSSRPFCIPPSFPHADLQPDRWQLYGKSWDEPTLWHCHCTHTTALPPFTPKFFYTAPLLILHSLYSSSIFQSPFFVSCHPLRLANMPTHPSRSSQPLWNTYALLVLSYNAPFFPRLLANCTKWQLLVLNPVLERVSRRRLGTETEWVKRIHKYSDWLCLEWQIQELIIVLVITGNVCKTELSLFHTHKVLTLRDIGKNRQFYSLHFKYLIFYFKRGENKQV